MELKTTTKLLDEIGGLIERGRAGHELYMNGFDLVHDARVAHDLSAENERLREALAEHQQLLMDADYVSRERFEYHGLCDCLDNNGRPYPSERSGQMVRAARAAYPTYKPDGGSIESGLAFEALARAALSPASAAAPSKKEGE